MSQLCPNCNQRLKAFAVDCSRCAWTLSEDTSSDHSANRTNGAATPHTDPMPFIEKGDFASALNILDGLLQNGTPEQAGRYHSLRGYVYLKMGEFAKAEADCDAAFEYHYTDSQTLAWRAAARGEQNRWRGAFEDLNAAYKNSTSPRDSYFQLLKAYSESAETFFREEVSNGRADAEMYFDRGSVYMNLDQNKKAAASFRKALEFNADHGGALTGIAELKMKQRDFKTAIQYANQAMASEAWKSKALPIRAQAAFYSGNRQAAFQDLDALRSMNADNSNGLLKSAKLRRIFGDEVGAIADLTQAIKINPLNIDATLQRSECYEAIRNLPLAEQGYRTYLQKNPENENVHINLGQILLDQDRLDDSLQSFDQALTLDKNLVAAHVGRSKVFLKKQEYDHAMTECDKAIRLDNTHPEVFGIRAEIYHGIGQYGEAIEDFTRSIEKAENDQDRASQLYHRGAAFFEQNHVEQALKDFVSATDLCPNHAGTWIWRAAACSKLERFSDAIISLEKAIAIRPSLAEQYRQLGQPVAESAIRHFSILLQRGHKDEGSYYGRRGLAHAFLGNVEQAITDYSASLDRNPADAEVRIRRAQMYAEQNQHGLAIKDFSRVIKNNPRSHWARFCRANSQMKQGDIEKAKNDITTAIKLGPNQPRYRSLLGELHQLQREPWKAIDSFHDAIVLDPHDPMLYTKIGQALLAQQQNLRAIYYLTRALELLPEQPSAHTSRGHAYLKLQQFVSARQDFEKALRMNENIPKAYTGRATTLFAMGEPDSAVIFLTKAIHRFSSPRNLAEILMERGKLFYKMGRHIPAILDFSAIVQLLQNRPAATVSARYGRAMALLQKGDQESAIKDFQTCLQLQPSHVGATQSIDFLLNSAEKPPFLEPPEEQALPVRPPVVTGPKSDDSASGDKFLAQPPYDSWLIKTNDKQEFGPVNKLRLNKWVSEGRINDSMFLLRADWKKWRRSSKIYPQLTDSSSTVFDSPEEAPLLPLENES